jgi:nitrite reductase (NADH) large subunit
MHYVIIGNGVAGTTAAAAARKNDPQGTITLVTDETYPFYSRIRLMEYLSGSTDEQGLMIRKPSWYDENRLSLMLGTRIIDVDVHAKKIISDSGKTISYDRLLLATGAACFVPPIPGADKKGVFTLRTLDDARRIRQHAEASGPRVLLIGGGVLGLEAGNSLRKAGKTVAVAEFFPRLLPRQMDPEGAGILKAQMENMGFRFYLGARSREIIGGEKVEALMLEGGTRIDCDMIIISAGIRHNVELASRLGLKIEKGLVVNDRMETEIAGIYAAGDLIQHRGVCYGIWPAAEKQGEIAGVNMAGGSAEYHGTTVSNLLKVAGIDLFAAGDIDAEGNKESAVFIDKNHFSYKKLVFQGDRIAGTILLGDIRDRRKIMKAIDEKTDISPIRNDLQQWDLGGL